MVDKAFNTVAQIKRMRFSSNSHAKKTTDQPNWSELPADLLELILKSLTAVDIIRFKAVCTSWMYATKYYPLPQPPWLMLPSNQQNDVNSRRFFDVADKARTIYTMTNLFRGFSDSWCIGSSHGWLVIVDKKTAVHLFNPLSGGRSIELPEIGTIAGIPRSFNIDVHILHRLCRIHTCKAVLSSNPSRNKNFMAAIIYNKRNSTLAYYKKGYRTWIELYNDHRESYSDVIFHNDDQLFALVRDGSSIDLWNLKENPVVITTIRLQPCAISMVRGERRYFSSFLKYASYLVESLDEILLVVRIVVIHGLYKTHSFRVFKVNVKNSQLEKVECLHDRVLFLGGNQSLSLSTRDFPALQDSSVYFTDDRWSMMNFNYYYLGEGEKDSHNNYGGHDVGVYSLEDGVVKLFDQIDNRQIIYPPPFWILP
ncbi:F-box protein At2g05970-like [Rosa rugosa]|uniref:F-box protein At2g05970-like n=1 Tax=Rosa rugosa TaxID=74645 RepID=UPI002B40E87B|nr:F-box protein At2g05970-like [Rosa rugosa]